MDAMTGMLPISATAAGSVAGLGGNPRIADSSVPVRDAGSQALLDREAFLKLLVAQLRYQDPSKPVDSSELITQSAQLSVVDQLSDIASMLQASATTERLAMAGSVVGKQVSFYGPDGFPMTGTVSHVMFEAGEVVLGVSGYDVPIDAVLVIYDQPDTPVDPPPSSPPPSQPVPVDPHPGAPPVDPATNPYDPPPPTGADGADAVDQSDQAVGPDTSDDSTQPQETIS